MTQYAFFFDQSRCYSCHACAVACKDWNDIDPGPEKWMSVYEWEEGSFPKQRVRSLAFPCAHCSDPACLKACPEGSIFKEDEFGAVLVDPERCTGCRACYEACPYGAPKFSGDDADAKMSKCTMCVDKLSQGQLPVCVSSCPLRAFDFGPLEEMEEKYGKDRVLDGMPDPVTKPNFIVKPAEDHKQLVPYDTNRALYLMQRRKGFEDVFSGEDAFEMVIPDALESSSLQMKFASSEELLAATRNFAG